ncbi:TetR/AcrR family transcriptional regulator [Streptomyces sp. NBC_00335]|uniref:TetR/AcrR family transcriptional regulator n=1 Tax=unclassified Streptomyces TaxID=2593676 RepID=UPI00225A8206|nr:MULTISPECIES: TetR/AcrR family transcriptional regulator [unclassified Streptomyces]MCX5407293.1 TetR/AcrR family transcriptional regulator [Streptomyces sp. NBC_00086]
MVSDAPRARRADAERNTAAIVDAGLDCFLADPQASMAAVARAAGVSRVTLYSHFPTREALLDAALDRAVDEAAATLEALDGGGGAAGAGGGAEERGVEEALGLLIRSSWRVLDRHSAVFAAVSAALPPERLRERHDRILAPVRRLIGRGRESGELRADLSADWLVTVVYSLVHAAAAEVQAGRMTPAEAPEILTATVLAAVTARPAAPGSPTGPA